MSLTDLLPDDLARLINDWTGLNRVGRHYFIVDPLVLDLDGDKVISDGREPFGDHTLLADGRVMNDEFYLMLA